MYVKLRKRAWHERKWSYHFEARTVLPIFKGAVEDWRGPLARTLVMVLIGIPGVRLCYLDYSSTLYRATSRFAIQRRCMLLYG